MALGLLGRKVGMTQIFDEDGRVIPVTVIQAGPCHILQLRTLDRDGYEAIQVGYLDKPRRKATRAERGHVAKLDSKRQRLLAAAGIQTLPKANCEPKRFIREFRHPVDGFSVGQVLTVELFQGVKAVDVTGTTKGRGFSGVMKRHGFAGQGASHGVKKVHRHPGSTGCNTSPGRVVPGRRMAGHYGHERCTIRNLQLVKIDPERHLLVVRGAVPGPAGGLVIIRPTNKVG
ncbi:LSU ribosomal protein L3p (L3e) [Thermogutta terrifontis]|jgi:large subunit ribosomal protein L3|uniref:Large ribosomal subunit protein uL3 n=1 Tax=Thermogutta terrifontis TaxID=1331910 RepID=A0A286RDE8_9BACT|nr:50S ribosomal protein L3 [Thermogutta terrifontis]ASV73989.1 LSU ribosomal protein L3p (L3e) [Thermogutta terrifontis]